MSRKPSLLHFVRGLVNGQTATCNGSHYQTADGRRGVSGDVRALIQAGALSGNKIECRANGETAGWLKRAMIDCDAFQAQHRVTELDAQGHQINLKESPLARLASGETAFLERHHVEAGERVRDEGEVDPEGASRVRGTVRRQLSSHRLDEAAG